MSEEDKRFVIQEHTQGTDVHWDFMLESGETLQTYRLDKAPEEILHQTAKAVKIFNHPLKFLTYQGPVNKGRGNVRLTEAGTYQIIHKKHNRIELNLSGKILKGKFTLTHIKNDEWQLSRDNQQPSVSCLESCVLGLVSCVLGLVSCVLGLVSWVLGLVS